MPNGNKMVTYHRNARGAYAVMYCTPASILRFFRPAQATSLHRWGRAEIEIWKFGLIEESIEAALQIGITNFTGAGMECVHQNCKFYEISEYNGVFLARLIVDFLHLWAVSCLDRVTGVLRSEYVFPPIFSPYGKTVRRIPSSDRVWWGGTSYPPGAKKLCFCFFLSVKLLNSKAREREIAIKQFEFGKRF